MTTDETLNELLVRLFKDIMEIENLRTSATTIFIL